MNVRRRVEGLVFDPDKDNEQVYDEQIHPLVERILEVCQANNLPMIASFQFVGHGTVTSTILPGGSHPNFYDALRVIDPDLLDNDNRVVIKNETLPS